MKTKMTRTTKKHASHLVAAAGMAAMMGWSATAHAAELSLAKIPLFLGSLVPPNVFFEFDDSGSMDWEILTKKHWEFCAYNPDAPPNSNANSNCGNLVTNGLWRSYTNGDRYYEYVYSSGDNAYTECTTDGNGVVDENQRGSIEGCGDQALANDWRVLSSDLNVTWYNPTVEYEPWAGPCNDAGDNCTDASFSAARSDPRQGKTGYTLTRNLAADFPGFSGFVYEVWDDNRGYLVSAGRPRRGTNYNGGPSSDPDYTSGTVDLWDGHTRIVVGSTSATVETFSYNPDATGLNPSTSSAALTDGTTCYVELGDQSGDPTSATYCRTIAEAQQNIANWYQYYRKRMLVAKNAVAKVVSSQTGMRFGLGVISDPDNLFVELPPKDATEAELAAHNLNLIDELFLYQQQPFGTPLRSGLRDAGEYYCGRLDYAGETPGHDPISHSCQRNYTILMTDGYYNDSAPDLGAHDDWDLDGFDNTLADVARRYYVEDIRPDLEDDVAPDPLDVLHDLLCPIIPALCDPPASEVEAFEGRQRMVTYTVGFGVEGNLVDTDGDGQPNPPLEVDGAWTGGVDPTPNNDSPIKIDDMWHAAFNSTGRFFSADTPTALAESIAEAVSDIDNRQSSAAAVALDSSALVQNARLYQARFNTDDWNGDLLSYPISDGSDTPSSCTGVTRGELCTLEWNAADFLAAQNPNARKIVTLKPNKVSGGVLVEAANGVAFNYSALSTEQQNLLSQAAGAVADPSDMIDGTDVLDYLRGKDNNEGTGTTQFRDREGKKLGDIVHSAPVFVGRPAFFYPDTFASEPYSAFVQAKKSRTPMVYVGANDGMLHGFHATDGDELIAYVPSTLYPKLHKLTDREYSHEYYVDGALTVGDAFFDDSGTAEWRTVLVGTLRGGGQGVFALDITDPADFSEANANNLVLWEFTGASYAGTECDPDYGCDPDLGYVFGKASVVKMYNQEWAAVFGNGYNNTEADGSASATGNAVLYIVDIEDGSLIRKIDTGVGMDLTDASTLNDRPNGLSEATVTDVNGDGIADTIYAGDLYGNLWKFDVSDASPSNWDVAFSGSPLFRATSQEGNPQPITSAPTVPRHPTDNEGLLVLFGTGQYFESDDNVVTTDANGDSTEPTQSFYAVYDDGVNNDLDRSDSFVEQKILREVTIDGDEYRITSSHRDPGAAGSAYVIDWSQDNGWYMDLVLDGSSNNQGERVVVNPVVRGDRVVFISIIPATDPCTFGGESWLMEVEYGTGSRLKNSPFLVVNNDGDLVEVVYTETVGGNQTSTIVSGRKFDEIISSPGIQLNPQNNTEVKYFSGSSGNVTGVKESTDIGLLGRQSWRQLR